MTISAKSVFNEPHLKVPGLESATSNIYKAAANLCSVFGSVEPIAIVVCGAGGDYALDMQENIIPLDELRRQVPTLDSVVNPLITPRTLTVSHGERW